MSKAPAYIVKLLENVSAPTDLASEQAGLATAAAAYLEQLLPRQTWAEGPDQGAFDEQGDGWFDGRYTAYVLARLLAIRSWHERIMADWDSVDRAILGAVRFVARRQTPDGRLDLRGVPSPNEIGFTLPGLVQGYLLWTKHRPVRSRVADETLAAIEQICRRGADAVVAGDAYTANHRWTAACAPLAAVNHLWPAERYLAKIDHYLADGIDCNAEGCWYHERSPNYDNVANSGLLVMAEFLARPELLDAVRRNLRFAWEFIQPTGFADASFSHRQDRASRRARSVSYGVARSLAVRTGDGAAAAMARLAWSRGDHGFDDLFSILYDAEARPGPLPPSQLPRMDPVQVYPQSGLVRVRSERTAATLSVDVGGHFFDTIRNQWGGPKRSTDWLHLQCGEITLGSLHVCGEGMSAAQPGGMAATTEGDFTLRSSLPGWRHPLHFRPGAPVVDMPWHWNTDLQMRWNASDQSFTLKIKSHTAYSLYGSLVFWIHAHSIAEGDLAMEARRGQWRALRGGRNISVRSGEDELLIEGLPAAAHQRLIRQPMTIPSSLPTEYTALSWGFVFPLELTLVVRCPRPA